MSNSPRKIKNCYYVFFIFILITLFSVLKSEKVAANEFDIPVYIIKWEGSTEIFMDRTELENYDISQVDLIVSDSGRPINISMVDESFFIYEELKNNNEYTLKINLLDKISRKNIEYSSNFKYLENSFSVKNITLNSCDVFVNYSGKDLLLIKEFCIYGKDISNEENEYDFLLKKSRADLNTYRSTFSFKNVSVKPGTTYNIGCVLSMSNNINLVFNKEFKSKDFEISEMKTSMISDRKIKLDWSISDDDFKFLDKDCIKIFVKKFGELNFPADPIEKILKTDIHSTTLDTGNVSSEYSVKLAYYFAGKEFERIIKQENDFYNINSKVSVLNSRGVRVSFGFDNKVKFNSGEILNIYLVDVLNDHVENEQIFSKEISSISFSPNHKVEFNNLKVDHKYKIIYEILYNDGTIVKIKEDTFSTPQFGIKDINVSGKFDNQNNLKVILSWQLMKSKFEFIDGDSLAIYIKEKDVPSYSDDAYFYKDTNLDKTFSLDIDISGEVKGAYDIKLVYNIGGKKYAELKSLYIDNEGMAIGGNIFTQNAPIGNVEVSRSGSIFTKNVSSEVVSDTTTDNKIVNVTAKDITANQVTLEVSYPTEFEFTDGDSIKIYTKQKDLASSSEVLFKEYVHSSNDESKVDLKNTSSFVVDYLIPNRNYEFRVEFKTKNEFKANGESGTVDGGSSGSDGEGSSSNDQSSGSSGGDSSSNGITSSGEEGSQESTEVSGSGGTAGSEEGSTDGKEENKDSTVSQSQEIDENGNGKIEQFVQRNGEGVKGEQDVQEEQKENESGSSDNTSQDGTQTPTTPSPSDTSTSEQIHTKEVRLTDIKTKDFVISSFETEAVRTNSAVFKWTLSNDITDFNEKDKLDIFIKRKIVGGYPVGSSFSKTGKDIKDVTLGETVVNHMNMEYTAKLVYTISGVKFEKTVDFVTKSGTTSCSTKDPTEHSVKLLINYPEEYKFLDDDSIEIYIKEGNNKTFGKIPLFTIIHDDEFQKLQDITMINLIFLKPQMNYEILVKFINRANDIPDCTTKFSTTNVVFQNCRIESIAGDKIRIKTDFKNGDDVFEYIKSSLYLDVFQKLPENKNYSSGSIVYLSAEETLDFELTLSDRFTDRDFLISFNPHGYRVDTENLEFNEMLFIEFEIPYRTIRAVIDESEITQDNIQKRSYSVSWAYHEPIKFVDSDKINIYLKEVEKKNPEQSNQNDLESKNINGYTKIQTITNVSQTTSFDLDYFINENRDYEVVVELESDTFKVGPGKVNLSVNDINLDEDNNEDINFDIPISVEDFDGLGDELVFSLPRSVSENNSINESDIKCDIEGLDFELNESDIKIKGLVPKKKYDKIEVKVRVDGDNELVFNLENVELDAEDDVQSFLYDVYGRSFLRDPDESGYKYWIDRLKTKDISARNFLINLLFAEKEFSEMNYSIEELITVLYSIVVNREPDSNGLNFWIRFYNDDALVNSNGDNFASKQYVVNRMINEKEFEELILDMGLEY